jgi:hypothetical protein
MLRFLDSSLVAGRLGCHDRGRLRVVLRFALGVVRSPLNSPPEAGVPGASGWRCRAERSALTLEDGFTIESESGGLRIDWNLDAEAARRVS